MWIKARHVPNKEGEMFPRRKSKVYSKGGKCRLDQVNIREKSSKEGEEQRGVMVLGRGQTVIG